MYNPKYDREEYKKMLAELINERKRRSHSPMSKNVSSSGGSSITTPIMSKGKKRTATPYHTFKSSKLKLSETSLKNIVSYDEALKDCPDSFLGAETSPNGNTDLTAEFGVKIMQRKVTPFRVNQKKTKKTGGNKRLVLFPSDGLSENGVGPSYGLTLVTTAAPRKRKRLKRNREANKKNTDLSPKVKGKNLRKKYNELICSFDDVSLNNSNFMFEEEEEHTDSDSNELNIKSDCSASVIYNDISMVDSSDAEEKEPESDESEAHSDDIINAENLDVLEEIEAQYVFKNDKIVVLLPVKSRLYFHGLANVTVLYGRVEVFGYQLTPDSDSVDVYSPRGSSLLYFETVEFTCTTKANLLKKLEEFEVQDDWFDNMETTSAVIILRNVDAAKTAFLEKHTSQQLFPLKQNEVPRVSFQNKINSEWSALNISRDWNDLVEPIDALSKVFICGGKSVGKSTLLRYMINKLLRKFPEILVVDLDPGQPEFTVSGCVSATVVNKPLFGPNYTHLQKPARCFFVPNINVFYEPDSYLSSIESLLHSCGDLPTMPTLINYMGFTRGLGLEIFSAAVAFAQPTSMIEIRSNSFPRNFKQELSHSLICERAQEFAAKINGIKSFPIHSVQSMADGNQGWHLEPRQIREMCVLTYFGTLLPKHVLSLTNVEVPVVAINLSEIKLIYNGKTTSPEIVNARLVALCSVKGAEGHDNSYKCHGWGIVRGIDLPTNMLYLITPLTIDDLEQVTCLVLGSVWLPPSLYMTSDNNRGLVPFVSEGVLSTTGQIRKRSHIPKNKYEN